MAENIIKLTPEVIKEFFKTYKTHVNKVNVFGEFIYTEKDRNSWIIGYMARSNAIREAYVDNTRIGGYFDLYFSGKLELDLDSAIAIFDELMDLDISVYDDAFYAVGFCNALIDYFKERSDLERLLRLYERLGLEVVIACKMGSREYAKIAYYTFLKIIAHRDKYASFEDFKVRRTFFRAYLNIITHMPALNVISIDKALTFLNEAVDFYESSKVQDIDSDSDELKETIFNCKKSLLIHEALITEAKDETIREFCKLARLVYHEECNTLQNEMNISSETLLANYRALVLERRCTYTDAVEYLMAYYRLRKEKNLLHLSKEGPALCNEFFSQTRLCESLIFDWLKNPKVSEDLRLSYTRILIEGENEYFNKVGNTYHTAQVNFCMTDWCFKTLNLLESVGQKEEALINVILKRQIQTFFHSYMVAKLSTMLTKSVLEKNRNLLGDYLLSMTDGQILNYVRKCALFHDIGKNRITQIINTQYRPLTDDEFTLIKRHPGIGADSVDEEFDAYHDVILGHHKWYDGSNGYPEKYDTSTSKVKSIIDIISICDSLDAGTDFYGRNYAKKKTFEDVLEELKEGAGTRYNPDFVALLTDDTDLYSQVNDLLSVNRENYYFDLVKIHLQSQK